MIRSSTETVNAYILLLQLYNEHLMNSDNADTYTKTQ